jgi:hypothetical protein
MEAFSFAGQKQNLAHLIRHHLFRRIRPRKRRGNIRRLNPAGIVRKAYVATDIGEVVSAIYRSVLGPSETWCLAES